MDKSIGTPNGIVPLCVFQRPALIWWPRQSRYWCLKNYLFLVHPLLGILDFGKLNKGKSTRGTYMWMETNTKRVLMTKFWQQSTSLESRGSPGSEFETLDMIHALLNSIVSWLQKRAHQDAIAHQLFRYSPSTLSRLFWKSWQAIAIVCVFGLLKGTCLFLPDEANVLGSESAPLDVVTDVGFRYVLG